MYRPKKTWGVSSQDPQPRVAFLEYSLRHARYSDLVNFPYVGTHVLIGRSASFELTWNLPCARRISFANLAKDEHRIPYISLKVPKGREGFQEVLLVKLKYEDVTQCRKEVEEVLVISINRKEAPEEDTPPDQETVETLCRFMVGEVCVPFAYPWMLGWCCCSSMARVLVLCACCRCC